MKARVETLTRRLLYIYLCLSLDLLQSPSNRTIYTHAKAMREMRIWFTSVRLVARFSFSDFNFFRASRRLREMIILLIIIIGSLSKFNISRRVYCGSWGKRNVLILVGCWLPSCSVSHPYDSLQNVSSSLDCMHVVLFTKQTQKLLDIRSKTFLLINNLPLWWLSADISGFLLSAAEISVTLLCATLYDSTKCGFISESLINKR